MRTYIILFAALLVSSLTYSQSNRIVLLEHFSNASCGSCAYYNPQVESLINANPKLISIKYQNNWPGYDPMNLHNPTDVNVRKNVYGVNGVPHSILDGNQYNNHPFNLFQANITNRLQQATNFEMIAHQALSLTDDSIFVSINLTSLTNQSGPFKLYIAVIENEISFASAPGSNGETDFHHVMKKLIPGPYGIELPSQMAANQQLIYNESWSLQNIYNNSELSVVAFIQDTTTHEIQQAAYAGTLPLIAKDAQASSETPNYLCDSTLTPTFILSNSGYHAISNAQIEYSINGGTNNSYYWQGKLLSNQSIELTLPSITANALTSNNSVHIDIVSINGSPDSSPSNDSITVNIASSIPAQSILVLEIQPDSLASELSWNITDDMGMVISAGGSYTDNNLSAITEYIAIDNIGCYTFQFNDASSNGFANGGGMITLTDKDGNLLIASSNFTSLLYAGFKIDSVSGSLPPWNYTETDSVHNIVLQTNLQTIDFSLQVGDFIGVFSENNGTSTCVGYTMFHNQLDIITVFGSEANTINNGDEFIIKAWHTIEAMERSVTATYNTIDYSFAENYSANGLSGISSLTAAAQSQSINIPGGWSIISTYIIPNDSNLIEVFNEITSNIIIVKDELGSVYWPQFSLNAIGSLIIGEGYQVKTTQATNLTVQGVPVQPEATSILLNAGWNILGYLRQSSANIELMLSPIVNDITIVKNSIGNIYWPIWSVNNIGTMQAGEGYQIKMSNSTILTYPAN